MNGSFAVPPDTGHYPPGMKFRFWSGNSWSAAARPPSLSCVVNVDCQISVAVDQLLDPRKNLHCSWWPLGSNGVHAPCPRSVVSYDSVTALKFLCQLTGASLVPSEPAPNGTIHPNWPSRPRLALKVKVAVF